MWWSVGPEPRIAHALVAGVTVLIIACPCAVGLATPMSMTVAMGRGAQMGVLFREARALEALASLDLLAVDKTGTLTEGRPSVALRRSAIERAIGNLVGNAQTFGQTVRLGVARDGRTLSFIVEDDGPGIPEADRASALRPFVRLDTARNQDRGGGTGLGLAIAADIAHAHGGSLELGESATLGGLRAVLCVPERDHA